MLFDETFAQPCIFALT